MGLHSLPILLSGANGLGSIGRFEKCLHTCIWSLGALVGIERQSHVLDW